MKGKPMGMRAGVTLLLLLLSVVAGAQEQRNDRPDLPKLFEKKEVNIPMRDGAKLHTEIYIPREASGPLPFLMKRTPYGIAASNGGYSR